VRIPPKDTSPVMQLMMRRVIEDIISAGSRLRWPCMGQARLMVLWSRFHAWPILASWLCEKKRADAAVFRRIGFSHVYAHRIQPDCEFYRVRFHTRPRPIARLL
jgi:hypothetical protein